MSSRTRRILRLAALVLLVASPARWTWDYLTATETWLSLHDARRREQMPDGLAQALVTVGGEGRLAIFAHPPSRLEWTLPLRRGRHRFTAELTINERAWEKTDGVAFRVAVVDQGHETEVGRWDFDPGSGPPHWRPISEVFQTSGQEVILALETSVGPRGNRDFDWAHWAEPRLVELTAPLHLPSMLLGTALLLMLLIRRERPAPP